MCQLNKYEYEKSGERFSKHVQKEHNVWNYANFIIYMKNKTEKDCNGIESRIFKKIKEGDLSWIPLASDSKITVNSIKSLTLMSKKVMMVMKSKLLPVKWRKWKRTWIRDSLV